MTATLKSRKRSGVTLATSDLKKTLAAVMPAVPSRTPKAVCMNVRFGDGLLTATDTEMQISAPIDWHGDPLLLPASRLSQILGTTSADEVTLSPDGSSCLVQSGLGRWTLPTEDAAEFPLWEPADAAPVVRVPADQLSRAIEGVAVACDAKSTRYALGGVCLDWKDGVANFVGTDGRRLCLVEVEVDQDTDPRSLLIPAKAAIAIAKASSSPEFAVQIEATSSAVIAEVDGITVTSRLVEGKFPRWRDVIPDRDVKPSLVGAGALLAAVRQAAICTSEQSKGVMFAISEKGIILEGRASETGESRIECELVEFGKAATFTLDPRYVSDWLKMVDSAETVEVEADGSGDAVVFRCEGSTGVVMPLAID
jgi:DNA polymerase-3 subunit beta